MTGKPEVIHLDDRESLKGCFLAARIDLQV
jgi:hypothetical protein